MVGGSTAFNFKSSPAARRLSSFLHAAERDPLFVRQRRTLSGRSGGSLHPKRSATILIAWKIQKYHAPPDPHLEMDELDDPDDEPRLENPVIGAEELLRFSRVRQHLEA
jgi:hypothetical protein